MSEIPRTNNPDNNPDHANDNPRTQENGHTESGYTRGQKALAAVGVPLFMTGVGFSVGADYVSTQQEPVVAAAERRIAELENDKVEQNAKAFADRTKDTVYGWIEKALQATDESGALPEVTFGTYMEERGGDSIPTDRQVLRIGDSGLQIFIKEADYPLPAGGKALRQMDFTVRAPEEVDETGSVVRREASFTSPAGTAKTIEDFMEALDNPGMQVERFVFTSESQEVEVTADQEGMMVRPTIIQDDLEYIPDVTPIRGLSWESVNDDFSWVFSDTPESPRERLANQLSIMDLDEAGVDTWLNTGEGAEEVRVDTEEENRFSYSENTPVDEGQRLER